MEKKKKYACSSFLLSEEFKFCCFAPTWNTTDTNFPSISFSQQLQETKTLPSTQDCTVPAMPKLLFMRLHDDLDHATDLILKR